VNDDGSIHPSETKLALTVHQG